MSSDVQTLSALSKKTDHECRYFELVTITNGSLQKKCFLGLAKHSLFFLRQNLSHSIHDGDSKDDGGVIPYAYVLNVVKDKSSAVTIMLVLSSNRQPEWPSERLYIDSERREILLRHLRCGWQTDYMWRLGKVAVLKVSEYKLSEDDSENNKTLSAFENYRWVKYQDYKFMVPDYFKESLRDGEWFYVASETTLIIQVHEPFTMDQLKSLGREHIRWVANDYIHNLLGKEDTHFYITRNEPFTKRMNLVGDRAAWYGWEFILKTQETTLLGILLRRQYIPPVCNTAQDIAVLIRCPRDKNETKEANYIPFWQKELRGIANSLCADAQTFAVYQDIVQAKLDTLRYDEDSVFWIGAYLKLIPMHRMEAIKLVRKLIEMYQTDGALVFPEDILQKEPKKVLVAPDPTDQWAGLDDSREVEDIIKDMQNLKDIGLPAKIREGSQETSDRSGTKDKKNEKNFVDEQNNKWFARVARYFAWAVDGGLVGELFTLDKMIDGLPQLAEDNKKQALYTLLFMLHVRERDFTKKWEEIPLSSWLRKPEKGRPVFSNKLPYDRKDTDHKLLTFNENVMTAFFRTEYVRKLQDDYYKLLGTFLEQDLGVQLKAYLCRILCVLNEERSIVESVRVVIDPLMSLLSEGEIFLATYATAALVNMTNNCPEVKNLLITVSAHKHIMKLVETKDDDLLCYTLMLLVNLTKEPHTREIIAETGLLPAIYDLLTSSTAQHGRELGVGWTPRKTKVLIQVCIIIGQFCNEDGWRVMFQRQYEYTANCLMFVFIHAHKMSVLAIQAMFALKQLCVNYSKKTHVGDIVIPEVVGQLKGKDPRKENFDFYSQSILLLLVLADRTKKKMMEENVIEVLHELSNSSQIWKSSKWLKDREGALKNMLSHGFTGD